MPMATTLCRMVTYNEELPPINSYEPLITWSCKVTWQIKCYISPTIMLVVTKPGRVKTYHGGLPLSKSHDDMVLWDHVTSKTYLYYHKGYDHQTWQSCDLPWGASNQKVTRSFDYMVLKCHETNQNTFYLLYHKTYCPQTWQRGYIEWQASTHRVTWSFDYIVLRNNVTNQINLHFHNACDDKTWQGGHLPWESTTHKVTWSFSNVVLPKQLTYQKYIFTVTMDMTNSTSYNKLCDEIKCWQLIKEFQFYILKR